MKANIGYLDCYAAENPVKFSDFMNTPGLEPGRELPEIGSIARVDVVYKIDRAREEEIFKKLLTKYFSEKKKESGRNRLFDLYAKRYRPEQHRNSL